MLDNIFLPCHKRQSIHKEKANMCHITLSECRWPHHPFSDIIRYTGRNTDESINKEA
jgi:hypothetical protein